MRYSLASVLVFSGLMFFIGAPATHAQTTCPNDTNGNPIQNGTCIPGGTSTLPNNGGPTVTNPSGSGPTATNPSVTLTNPLKAKSLEEFLGQILDFIIRIGTIVIVLVLVYVGYLFVIARGAPGELSAAKKALLWSLIGALILLGAKGISVALQATVASVTG